MNLNDTRDKLFEENVYHIVFSINKAYLLYCMITLFSVLKNHSNKVFFNFHIIHDGDIKQQDIDNFLTKEPLEVFANYKINLIDSTTIELLNKIDGTYKWPKMVFYKIFLPNILDNNIHTALALDVDLIINNDLTYLLNLNMGDKLFAGDNIIKLRPERIGYLNGGCILFNLQQLRKENISEQWFNFLTNPSESFLKSNRFTHEENVLNYLFKERIEFINTNYIVTTTTYDKKPPIKLNDVHIIHYTYCKPWLYNRTRVTYLLDPWFKYYSFFINRNKRWLYYLTLWYMKTVGNILSSFTSRLKYMFAKHFKLEKISKLSRHTKNNMFSYMLKFLTK